MLEVFRQWMDANPIGHVMPSCDKASFAGSPCEAIFNLDHCFVRDSLRTHALLLLSTKGLGVKSDHRHELCLTLGSAWLEEWKTLRLPRYRICLLNEQARVDAVRRLWDRHCGHR